MNRKKTKARLNIDAAPGTLIQSTDTSLPPAKITYFEYSEDYLNERQLESLSQVLPLGNANRTVWINVDGLYDNALMQQVMDCFGIHPLVIEDIQTTTQRPKTDTYESYLFLTLKMLQWDEKDRNILAEQVSLLIGKNYVISFQEVQGDVFDPIRDRIRRNKGRIRRSPADYLAYSLVDSIVDNYFLILEEFEEQIDEVEEQILTAPRPNTPQAIHDLKRKILSMRKAVWPLREVVNRLEKFESTLIHNATKPYLADVYDHTIQIIDTVETIRDITSGLLDIYLSNISNSMNSVMKVLTIIATIFIPLTFIAGVYGMNFQNMPELSWAWGYPVVVGVMVMAAVGMLFYFKRKKWL